MSCSIPQCDSDEELFWEPVTAKEAEFLMKYRMAHRKKELFKMDPKIDEDFMKKTIDLNKPSDQSGCHQNNFSSLQEVPSLKFRKLSGKENTPSLEENICLLENKSSNVQENCFSKPDNTNLTDSISLVAITNTDMSELNESKKLYSISSGKNLSFSNKVEIFNPLVTNIELVAGSSSDDTSSSECSHHVLNEKTNMSKEHLFTHSMNTTLEKENINFENNYFKHSSEDGTDLNIQPATNDLNQSFDVATKSNYRNEHSAVGLQDIVSTKDQISEVRNIKTDSVNLGKMDGESLADLNNSETVDDVSNKVNVSSIKKSELSHHCSIVMSSRESIVGFENSEVNLKCSDSNLNRECNVNSLLKQSDEYHSDKYKHEEGVKRELNDFCYTKGNVDPSNAVDRSNHILKHENQKEVMSENQNHFLESVQLETNESSKIIDTLNNANDSNESSDKKSFVSLNSEEDSLSSNNQCVAIKQDCLISSISTNKENEDPSRCLQDTIKSKIPVANAIYKKTVVLKPSKLHSSPGVDGAKDFKLTKIPKSKKPDSIVSPAKLGGILKNHSQLTKQPDKVPLINTKMFSEPNPSCETPKPLFITPKKKKFDYIKSPISEYVRSGTGITPAKSLPALQTAYNIPRPLSTRQSPLQKLTPKFYSSAEKFIIKPGPSSLVPQEKKAKGFSTSRIFKHQGKVFDERKHGEISVVTPRAVRTTDLHDNSVACLPQSPKSLDVSVSEEQ